MSTLDTFIANLQRAVRDNETVDLGGGAFSPAELRIVCACLAKASEVSDGLRTAIWRIEDMLKGDDGQAFKEAERFLPQARKLLEVQA